MSERSHASPPPISGLARSLRDLLDQVAPAGTDASESAATGRRGSMRDRFTTRIALYLEGDEERREALRPGLQDDVRLLHEAGEEGPLMEAAQALSRRRDTDPLLRELWELLSSGSDRGASPRDGSPRRSP